MEILWKCSPVLIPKLSNLKTLRITLFHPTQLLYFLSATRSEPFLQTVFPEVGFHSLNTISKIFPSLHKLHFKNFARHIGYIIEPCHWLMTNGFSSALVFVYLFVGFEKRVSEDGLCNSQSVHVTFSSLAVSLFAYVVIFKEFCLNNP